MNEIDLEMEDSKERKEKYERELGDAARMEPLGVARIANRHEYSCRCGFCMTHLMNTQKEG